MKRAALTVGAICLAWFFIPRLIPSSIDYRGEPIKLSRFYFSYEDYKDDPNNIDASETARVQRLVFEAPIAHSFRDRKEMAAAVVDIKFPGYAAGGFGGDNMNSDLVGFSVEIPRSKQGRYLVFKKDQADYVLLDDFLDATMPGINHVEESGGNLIYSMGGRPERLVHRVHNFP